MDKKNETVCDPILAKNENYDVRADILIVDDVYANVFLVENMLNDHYCVESVNSGEEMRRYLRHKTPKLILLDLMIPFEDGFSILGKMKADQAHSKIPVIVVSAKDSKDDVLKAMRMGAVDYVVKPVDERVLLAKIANVIGRR